MQANDVNSLIKYVQRKNDCNLHIGVFPPLTVAAVCFASQSCFFLKSAKLSCCLLAPGRRLLGGVPRAHQRRRQSGICVRPAFSPPLLSSSAFASSCCWFPNQVPSHSPFRSFPVLPVNDLRANHRCAVLFSDRRVWIDCASNQTELPPHKSIGSQYGAARQYEGINRAPLTRILTTPHYAAS